MNISLRPTKSNANHLAWSVLFCLFAGFSYGQQLPQFALTPWSWMDVNPAATGLGDDLIFSGAARRQWNSLPGSPSGYHISAQMPLPAIRSGFGVALLQDQIGLLSNLEASLVYAYHVPISRVWSIHAGLAGGFLQSGLDGQAIRTPDGQYGNGGVDHQDSKLPNNGVTAWSPMLHLGGLATNDTWTFGASLRYAQGGQLNYSGTNAGTAGMNVQPHLALHGSWKGSVGDLEIMPSTVWLSDFSQWQATALCSFTWKERFVVGGGYRGWKGGTQDALILTAGFHVSDRFLLLYAYESGVSALKQVHNGSFELMLQYRFPSRFNRGKLPGIIYNPRFL